MFYCSHYFRGADRCLARLVGMRHGKLPHHSPQEGAFHMSVCRPGCTRVAHKTATTFLGEYLSLRSPQVSACDTITMRSAPVYSQDSSSSELLLQHDAASSSDPGRWIYTTKHMEVDLGPRMWAPSHAPCYGLNGKIEGSIRFSGNLSSVTKVTLTVSRRHICEMHPTF